MKASFVSSSAINQAMRYSLMKTQAALVNAQKEQATGFFADKGLALGASTSQSVTFNREVERMKGIVASNALATTRLTATQNALGQVSTAAQSFLSILHTAMTGDSTASVTKDMATDALKTMTSVLNTGVNGEFIFAGVNTDAKPINDYSAPGSPAKAAYDAAYAQYLADTGADPADPFPTAADMNAFLDTYVEPQFTGAGWDNWSNASDQSISSRISLNETTETSASANNDGFRKLAMATTMISELMSGDLPSDARKALVDRAWALVSDSISDIVNLQSKTGIAEKRVADASERLNTQTGLIEKHILATEGVDPLEANTRVADLLSHIETSYAITARIQQLSLLKFLS
ncbi:flagellar hook-associated family protein [Mesorhizobium sp. DCY119]|jgi:flagellar hook-associated protein 3 FlgL|uniref:flagellar hook-associated family protein n=1 Tax=Mesorhizobium sp. DCY119 TaxID=2108445 RepID=UPI000E6BBACF|nr:flagellar hook-associated family protein [Mesorhizobium sp. DCY119]RJG44079.1 flagellar hook-associated family protein [Mesorhizobium sp. DCY119]